MVIGYKLSCRSFLKISIGIYCKSVAPINKMDKAQVCFSFCNSKLYLVAKAATLTAAKTVLVMPLSGRFFQGIIIHKQIEQQIPTFAMKGQPKTIEGVLLCLRQIVNEVSYSSQGIFQLICSVNKERYRIDLQFVEQNQKCKQIGMFMYCFHHLCNKYRRKRSIIKEDRKRFKKMSEGESNERLIYVEWMKEKRALMVKLRNEIDEKERIQQILGKRKNKEIPAGSIKQEEIAAERKILPKQEETKTVKMEPEKKITSAEFVKAGYNPEHKPVFNLDQKNSDSDSDSVSDSEGEDPMLAGYNFRKKVKKYQRLERIEQERKAAIERQNAEEKKKQSAAELILKQKKQQLKKDKTAKSEKKEEGPSKQLAAKVQANPNEISY